MMVVPPQSSFHCVEMGEDNKVGAITAVSEMPLWENGGYFVLRQEVFDHIPEGGDLVADGCGELAKRGRLLAYPYRGFWKPTDTVKEKAAARRRLRARRAAVGAVGQRPQGRAGSREDRVIRLGADRIDRVVALGAHCDDIAIGAGGTLYAMCAARPGVRVDALVLSGGGTEREDEERAALAAFCPGADLDVTVHKLPDGRLPAHWDEAKNALEELRGRSDPDVLFAPRVEDAHQDHRGLAQARDDRVP